MTREIKFRGLRTDGKGWVYGDLIHTPENKCRIIGFDAFYSDGISDYKEFNHIVLPETVGQLSNSLTRKAGGDVYVGDRISYQLAEGLGYPKSKQMEGVVGTVESSYGYYINVKVIGNIHDRQDGDKY